MFQNPKIGIVGLGMVGLPLKKYFEEKGFKRGKNLFLYDKNEAKCFLDDMNNADIVFVCVPTPSNKDGSCNTSIVESVVKQFKDSGKILILKSTIEPGTAFRLKKKYNCQIFFSPEFLTEANAWNDFIKPDRQIVGHTNDAVLAKHILGILPLASSFKSPSKDIKINAAEAEIGKYGANVFGAMKVVYGNVLADFCAALENNLKKDKIETIVHYDHVKNIMGFDRRIGFSWLNVNHGDYRGFGGYCFPKDTDAFIAFAKKLEKKLSAKDKEEKRLKKLVERGVKFLEAMRNYNVELLKTQGLTVKNVSRHDKELEEKLKNLKIQPKAEKSKT